MCGIAGQLDLIGSDRDTWGSSPAARATVTAMCDALYHRGPDDGGIMASGPLVMGMRRLSIIDLGGGRQPISNEDGTISVVCNGEIYNYRELTAGLRARGHVFRTDSDCEVIVHLYEEHGLEFARYLRGMFAFALWDARERRLVLGRDRLGIKPLHFATDGRRLVFGSEIKALVAAGVGQDLDLQALHHYLTLSYVPAPHTIYAGINKLLPAHLLVVENGNLRIERFWHLEYPPQPDGVPVRDYVEALDELLVDAVRSHLVADVPIGVFLSGGLDSASILALMREQVSGTIKTFSVGFADESFNELGRARLTATRYATEHHEMVIPATITDTIPSLIEAFDEPFADSSAIPLYYLSRFAREHVKVVLSGDGGDEIFGGYQTYVASKLAHWYRQLPKSLARSVIPGMVGRLPVSHRRVSFDYKAKRFVHGALLPTPTAHCSWKEIFSEDAKARLYTAGANGHPATHELYANLFAGCPSGDWLTRLLHVDTHLGLPDDMLTKVDRVTMANALEARVPLLDHHLVEFMASVPSRLKVHGLKTKYLFRRAVKERLPRAVLRGRKRGFNVPMPGWLAHELRSFVGDTLSPHRIAAGGVFRPEVVSRLVDEHTRRVADHSRNLWTLIVLEHWRQHQPTAVRPEPGAHETNHLTVTGKA
jgi:asparagine synthase (glutamine-hydrolysing)